MAIAPDLFKIAIVDDSSVSRLVVSSELSARKDFVISEYDNSVKALAELGLSKPDMVISDLIMPEINGIQLCQAMRQNAALKNIPFILLSALINNDVRARALQAGVTETIKKPFRQYELFKYVSKYVDSVRHSFDHSVLIVDDSQTTLAIFSSILEEMNLKVHKAGSIKEASAILEKHPIELILLDNLLPDGKGIEWCRHLRSTEDFKWVPVLGVSSDTDLSLAFLDAGADDYISKQGTTNMEMLTKEINVRARNLLKRVSLTKDLNDAVAKEKALNDQKNKLLGMAAHDLRNPLAIMLGNINNINSRILDEKGQVKALAAISITARQMSTMLNDILDVSAIESGIVQMQMDDIVLNDIIEERLEAMNEIGTSKGIKGTFINNVGQGAKVVVNGDRSRLSQVLDNLMSNAIKYSERNTSFIVKMTQEIEGIVVEVLDNGKGIPANEVAGLFSAFKKTSVKATAGERSTGLGLAIVKKLIEGHGGRVWVKSKVGEGSTFAFLLPGGRLLAGQ